MVGCDKTRIKLSIAFYEKCMEAEKSEDVHGLKVQALACLMQSSKHGKLLRNSHQRDFFFFSLQSHLESPRPQQFSEILASMNSYTS